MALALHTLSGSPYGWRVQLALLLKGVPHELRILSLSAGDLRTPEYLAVNPRGRVPTLVDGDVAVYESLAILAYLEARYPDPPLFGRTPAETGRIWQRISEYTHYLDAAVEDFILPLYFGTADADRGRVERAIAVVAQELQVFETALASDPYLCGEEVTAADCVLLPALQSLRRAGAKDAAGGFSIPFLPLAERFPRAEGWRLRMEALPGYASTIPPHWR